MTLAEAESLKQEVEMMVYGQDCLKSRLSLSSRILYSCAP